MRRMEHRGFEKGEVARLGQDIYEREIRAQVEASPGGAHDGEFLVVDVTTGAWEVDASDVAASDRALKKNPDALLYFMRVGRPTAYRIGGFAWGRTPGAHAGSSSGAH